MFFRLFLLFTAVPLLELMLLVELGRAVGLMPTLGLVLLTGAAGAWAARTQGFYVLGKIRGELSQGRLPGEQLVDGVLVLVGGLLLLTPGLLTDAVGFSLMIPPWRRRARGWLVRKFERMIQEGKVHIVYR